MKSICISLLVITASILSGFPKSIIEHPESGKQFVTMYFRFEENLQFENPFDLLKNKVELQIIQPDNSNYRVG